MTGLEVWLNGTKDELRAAWAALHAIGTVTQLGELHPIEETGRYRTYIRLAVAATAVPAPPRRPAAGSGPALPLAG